MKRWLSVGFAVLCAVGVIAGYQARYPIRADQSNLEASIDQWFQRGHSIGFVDSVETYSPVTLGDAVYLPIEVEEGIGYLLLKRGLTGKYRILHSSCGDLGFYNGVVEADGEKYLLFLGRNQFGQIARAEFLLDDGREYEMTIPTEPVFLVSVPVDPESPVGSVFLDNITLYDPEEKDVTSEIYLSGGTITGE